MRSLQILLLQLVCVTVKLRETCILSPSSRSRRPFSFPPPQWFMRFAVRDYRDCGGELLQHCIQSPRLIQPCVLFFFSFFWSELINGWLGLNRDAHNTI